jgi:uncharacterized repeat protein (TIGR03803 family)
MKSRSFSFALSTRGLAVAAAGLSALVHAQAWAGATETTLHTFAATEGVPGVYSPDSLISPPPLVKAGFRYYGVMQGGAGGHGAVFSLTATGTFSIVHVFNGADGDGPIGLTVGSDGNLYGTTEFGGSSNEGTVFKLTTGGAFTLLHSFSGGADGNEPFSGLIQASDGNFYGTTGAGGVQSPDSCPADALAGSLGCGTIYRITPSGSETVIHAFSNAFVPSGVIQASDGNLYGEVQTFWTNPSDPYSLEGPGFIYRVGTDGSSFTTLHTFAGGEGVAPQGNLLQAADGNFYGTTQFGGSSNKGTVYQMTPAGTLATLYSFTGGSDGAMPLGALIQGKSTGYLYGVTASGGNANNGTIYRMATSGVFTPEYAFTGGSDGSKPSSVLAQLSWNKYYFYGTTQAGGSGNGTLYKVRIPLY